MDDAIATTREAFRKYEAERSRLLAENVRLQEESMRLRGWLRAMVEQTARVDEPCGWCVELQGWATDALLGKPVPGHER